MAAVPCGKPRGGVASALTQEHWVFRWILVSGWPRGTSAMPRTSCRLLGKVTRSGWSGVSGFSQKSVAALRAGLRSLLASLGGVKNPRTDAPPGLLRAVACERRCRGGVNVEHPQRASTSQAVGTCRPQVLGGDDGGGLPVHTPAIESAATDASPGSWRVRLPGWLTCSPYGTPCHPRIRSTWWRFVATACRGSGTRWRSARSTDVSSSTR